LGSDTVNLKIASFILEMWFKWHESMWVWFPKFIKVCIKLGNCELYILINVFLSCAIDVLS